MTPAFPPRARLRSPREFEAVLKAGRRVQEKLLTLVVLPTLAPEARLGLAISVRAVPKATGRNRIKRLARESFRACRAQLPAADLVLQARSGAGAADSRELRSALERLWQKVREP
ncbi:MAG: ribonuclease P protein component [Gammaproteobacteria bacterium]